MKLSVRDLDKEYIGSYIQDYIDVGLYHQSKDRSIEDVKRERIELKKKIDSGDVIYIGLGRFAGYVLGVLSEYGNPSEVKKYIKLKDFSIIKSRLLNKLSIRYIDKSDYNQIENILDIYPDLKSYIDDFALMVIYAKRECFNNRRTQEDMFESLMPQVERNKIRSFYAQLLSDIDNTDTQNITISYAQKGKNKKIKIESPVLLKMMLFQFAKEYYTFVERADKETFNLEYEVSRCSKVKIQGSPGNSYTKNLRALLHVYWDFMEHEGLFNNIKTVKEKYLLIGKLLVIAGHYKFDERRGAYIDEADYHYKVLKKYWFKKER